jgi:ferredoxin-type protein NapG
VTDRRGFFSGTLGRVAREVAVRAERRFAPRRFIRPPGAAPEPEFIALCTRCGDCVAICPVHAIRLAPADAGLAAGTPMLDPAVVACVACADMPCARACGTGALVAPPDGWKGVHLGVLVLDPERCITFHGAACDVCVRTCPVGESALALDARGHPVLKTEGCVGCGMCVTACVTRPSSLALHLSERS